MPSYKYLVIAAIALAFFASCERIETEGQEVLSPIEFGSAYVCELKSSLRDDGFVGGDAIGVLACYLPPGQDWEEYRQTAVPDFMYNQKVTYDGVRWSYSPTMYWPQKDGARVCFYAYYPWSDRSGDYGVSLSSDDSVGEPSFVFTLNDMADIDLMVAKTEGLSVEDGDVALEFTHVLSKVCFRIKVEEDLDFADVINSFKLEFSTTESASYSWSDGEFREWGAGRTVELSMDSGTLVDGFDVYLIPKPDGNLGNVNITVNGEDPVEHDLSAVSLVSGRKTTVTLLVTLSGVDISILEEPWVGKDAGSGQIS